MTSDIKCLCSCETCQGTGRVWETRKGDNVRWMVQCFTCWGLGSRWRRLTSEEKRELGQKLLEDTAT